MKSKNSYEEFDFIQELPEVQEKKQQPVFKSQQFLLVAVINLILLTVNFTVSKILFLFTFVTIALKFYKNFVLQKHIDKIEIQQIQVAPKSSLFIHFLSIFLYHLMESKSINKNIFMFGVLTVIYFIFHFININVVILLIVDACYFGNLFLKYKNKNKKRNLQIKRTESLLYNEDNDLKNKKKSDSFVNNASQIIQQQEIEQDLKKSEGGIPKKEEQKKTKIIK